MFGKWEQRRMDTGKNQCAGDRIIVVIHEKEQRKKGLENIKLGKSSTLHTGAIIQITIEFSSEAQKTVEQCAASPKGRVGKGLRVPISLVMFLCVWYQSWNPEPGVTWQSLFHWALSWPCKYEIPYIASKHILLKRRQGEKKRQACFVRTERNSLQVFVDTGLNSSK